MPRSRTKKATLNIVTSGMLEVMTMLSGLILPRYILRYFGSSYNGITASASQFLSMISVLTLGVTASTRVALYRTLTAHDLPGTSVVVRATERSMRKVGLILGIYIVGLAVIYPLVVQTGFSWVDVASLILIVGMSSFAEYFFGITYRTFLLADQSVFISNLFSCAAILLNVMLSVFLIIKGCSIHVVKLGSATVFVLRPLLQNLYVTKKYKLDKHCEPDMTALNRRGDAMMHALANIVHDHTDIIVLTLFAGVKTVSVYTVYNMIMGSMKKLQGIFTTGTEPIFGSMWAGGEHEKIRRNLGVFEFFANAFNAVAFSIAMVMVLPFISLYVPKNVTDINYIRPAYACVISLAFATHGIRIPYLTLVQGAGHYKETRNAAIIEAVINLVISVTLVNLIGMVGVAIGTLAANLYRTIHYGIYIDNHIVSRGKHIFLFKLLWTLMNMTLIVVPAYLIVSRFSISNWWEWLLFSTIVGIYACTVVLVSAWLFYRKDLQYAFHVAKAMIRRKSRQGTMR